MLCLLIPLTIGLVIQDWRWQRVDLSVAMLAIGVLAIGVSNGYLALAVFSILWLYQRFRPGSVQMIDIAIFGLGAGYFAIPIFSVYCLVTAIVLLALNKLKAGRLPFLVAWAVGFWTTLCLQCGVLNHFLPSSFINNFND